jgi:2-dehydropantoate 2-reductase
VTGIKNITVIGIGGVGGYFGGKLAYSLSQNNSTGKHITFVARGNHYKKINDSGLNLYTDEGHFICNPSLVTENILSIPSPDLVLLCVKSYDLESSITQLEKVIHPNTIILPLLNGVDIYDRIRAVTKKGIIFPSCVYVASHIAEAGKVVQKGPFGTIISGNTKTEPDCDVSELIDLFNSAKINFKWTSEPFKAIWEKYIFVASFAVVTAYANKSFVEVSQKEDLKRIIHEVMDEIILLANASGVNVPENIFESSLAKANNLPLDSKTSYQRDVEKGSKNEGDIFGQAIINKGKIYNIPTPTTESLYNEIQRKLNIQ